jgi:hypothetical protein
MIRPKTPEQIRASALQIGAEKLLSDCTPCAEGYFGLARQYGACEAEIEAAVAAARQRKEQWELGRRDFLKSLAVAAAGVAVVNVTGASPSLASESSVLAAAEATQIAWIETVRSTGVAPRGTVDDPTG